ncbi:MAG TPA: hypothetical protein VFF30_14470 [Nitrososphaerales archaeon]|nr:hypothetical protein [Nitrososphaerales archaeon]
MSASATSTAAITPAIIAEMQASSYRVKFAREQFLELVEIAHPKIIYRRKGTYFFAFDGFVMYCQQCKDDDFPDQKVIEAIEFSNGVWST